MTQVTDGFIKPKLQLSNGYTVNFTYLARILNAVCQDERERIPQVDLATTVGIAERHVKHLCGIAHALGLIERVTYKPTALGRLIHRRDPFFDDVGTLWFLHYMISSNPYNLVWNRMITTILPTHKNVTREQARNAFLDLRQALTEYSSQKHVLQELNTVLDAYTNQHFARIAYLYMQDGIYTLNVGENIPALVLGACIICFRQQHRAGDTAVTIEDLLSAPNGPGIVLQLPENRLRMLLEHIKLQPDISIESRADLDQVRFSEDTRDYLWMERYYACR
jgi:hypothetical protein